MAREIRTAVDADSVRDQIEMVYDGWYADTPRIDWEDFLDRLERYDLDLGDSMESAAIRRIKSIVRELRSMG
jgi:hypothetical protein